MIKYILEENNIQRYCLKRLDITNKAPCEDIPREVYFFVQDSAEFLHLDI